MSLKSHHMLIYFADIEVIANAHMEAQSCPMPERKMFEIEKGGNGTAEAKKRDSGAQAKGSGYSPQKYVPHFTSEKNIFTHRNFEDAILNLPVWLAL